MNPNLKNKILYHLTFFSKFSMCFFGTFNKFYYILRDYAIVWLGLVVCNCFSCWNKYSKFGIGGKNAVWKKRHSNTQLKYKNKCLISLKFRTFFCNLGLSLSKDTTSLIFLQESPTMFCDDFPAYLSSTVEISWWYHSPSSSLTTCRFGGKKPKRESKKIIFSDINYTPESGMRLEIPQQFSCSFRRISFQRNLDKPLWTFAMQISQFPPICVQIDKH